MALDAFERAEVLTQALPYIRRYTGKIVVVKYGGNAMKDPDLQLQVMEDVALLWLIGVKIVLVHGGGPDINALMKQVGKQPHFVNGLRVTDQETIDIVQMVLAGKVNKHLVQLLEMKGGHAIGLSGIDARMLEAEQKDPQLGYVGEITHVNTQPILDVLAGGYIPVISTIATDAFGHTYNVNGDVAAAHIAGALNAERLIFMTDIAGILRDKNDPTSLITNISVSDAEHLREQGIISGGMIPKVEFATKAIGWGVKNVVIMDGTAAHSIIVELLTNQGVGTWIRGEHHDR
ncbi:MAG: acetylglutamate kinase [Actinomycetaceae bacterium]|nr:acetylglutamate kinase [Actinomycetaceae bacterium]MDY5854599.1 acetylglutamate kinase [Arcanobacterium sp.]